jgi:hypothetical protein
MSRTGRDTVFSDCGSRPGLWIPITCAFLSGGSFRDECQSRLLTAKHLPKGIGFTWLVATLIGTNHLGPHPRWGARADRLGSITEPPVAKCCEDKHDLRQ